MVSLLLSLARLRREFSLSFGRWETSDPITARLYFTADCTLLMPLKVNQHKSGLH